MNNTNMPWFNLTNYLATRHWNGGEFAQKLNDPFWILKWIHWKIKKWIKHDPFYESVNSSYVVNTREPKLLNTNNQILRVSHVKKIHLESSLNNWPGRIRNWGVHKSKGGGLYSRCLQGSIFFKGIGRVRFRIRIELGILFVNTLAIVHLIIWPI